MTLRLMVEFQWFLIALSVRPGRALAISAQRLPFDCMRVWFRVWGSELRV
jgi:hypothetical protein